MIGDIKAFRSALGSFATGVTIVTALDRAGRPVGLTANSFSSVSLDPPLVLWSLALASPNLAAFRETAAWAVHVLASDQTNLSNQFATRGIDKFDGLDIGNGPEGAPLIAGCAARFGCQATFEYEGGDHAIFVGEVVEFSHSDRPPLVFHRGRYGAVYSASAQGRPAELTHNGEFGRYFLAHLLYRAHHATFGEVRREYRKRGLRSAEYSAIVALGLGDGCTPAELVRRAANGGVALDDAAINGLVERGLVEHRAAALHLSRVGQVLLAEMMAVAQASQLELESRFEPYELTQLASLLDRLSDSAME